MIHAISSFFFLADNLWLIIPLSLLTSVRKQVDSSRDILCIPRIELYDSLEQVVGFHGDRLWYTQDVPDYVLTARWCSKGTLVVVYLIVNTRPLKLFHDVPKHSNISHNQSQIMSVQ